MRQRLQTLTENGHATDKVEYIVKGGTWNAYTLGYQYWYILESFLACNDGVAGRTEPSPYTEHTPVSELQAALAKAQTINETAPHRIIGLTLETRPDAISPKTIWHMRQQGCTRVELGLQATDDAILALIKRGHTVQQFRDAMLLLRQAGFKVDLHFMPDLPGSSPAHDVEMYQEIFADEGLRPDMIKIYPNSVIKSAELYQWFLDGRYVPYGDTPAMSEALMQMKLATPRYCRISRLIRDIPATEIEGGNTVTNLREFLEKKLHAQGLKCVCLRCREISRQIKNIPADTEPQLFVDEYETTGGTEYFITFEDPNRIAVFGFLRLRVPTIPAPESLIKHLPVLENTAFIRELHVYGRLMSIGQREDSASQHTGLGKQLMAAAEKITRQHGLTKVAVISGVGVRDYYRHLGYELQDTYLIKTLTCSQN